MLDKKTLRIYFLINFRENVKSPGFDPSGYKKVRGSQIDPPPSATPEDAGTGGGAVGDKLPQLCSCGGGGGTSGRFDFGVGANLKGCPNPPTPKFVFPRVSATLFWKSEKFSIFFVLKKDF